MATVLRVITTDFTMEEEQRETTRGRTAKMASFTASESRPNEARGTGRGRICLILSDINQSGQLLLQMKLTLPCIMAGITETSTVPTYGPGATNKVVWLLSIPTVADVVNRPEPLNGVDALHISLTSSLTMQFSPNGHS
jgi:hypothetical protein